MWLVLALISAVLLGVYDVFKKYSVNENAVFPVLLFSCSSSALLFVPVFILSATQPEFMKSAGLFLPTLNIHEHVLVILKSIIVVSSWTFAFFALKNLPLTIVSPIRATSPVWTLIGALLIFSEKLTPIQWTGLGVTITFFFLFSTAGKTEGISFRTNKWIWFVLLATLLGSASALYDKHLMQNYNRIAIQAWFSVYQVVLLLPTTLLFWYPKRKAVPFKWRWTIPMIGLFLVISDFTYFYALSDTDSLISVISAIRRSGVVVAFTFGALIFKEKNIRRKSIYLAGILVGVMLLMLS
ncbi:EamA family transporter [Saccharicrinis sp. FJH62]|uniref:EamA family transporter n=1 Tax=Saccharicrinis sp. FJH62 TaxID=3344657 RepID=UPI0035D45564